MNWRHTHVWEINRQLVVADTVEEAISIYRMYSEKGILSEPITIRQIGNSDAIGKDYSAIMREIPPFATEPGTYVKDYERNPKPVPTDNKPIDIPTLQPTTAHTENKPIDIMDMMDNQYDVRWSNAGQGNTTGLDWMHRETTTFYGD